MNVSTPDSDSSFCHQPASVEELAGLVRAAVTERHSLQIGSASVAAREGRASTRISLRRMNAIVDYPARDMTITVQAGMTVGALRQILEAEGQQLPIDAGDEQTLGALVACDVYGPRRYGYGTLRDYLIGVEAVDGIGRVFHAGGRVVKNVAGYDLCRLLTGSRGAFGMITRLTFKLKPLAPHSRLIVCGFRNLQQLDSALERLNRTQARPVVLDVVNRSASQKLLNSVCNPSGMPQGNDSSIAFADCVAFVVLGVEGTEESCIWQENVLKDELLPFLHWIHSTSQLDGADPVGVWCHTVTQWQTDSSAFRWLLRLTTLPSRVVSTMTMLKETGCGISGHAGNGVLYINSDNERSRFESDTAKVPASQSDCMRVLRDVIADGVGSLRLLKSEQTGLSSTRSGQLQGLVSSLCRTFDPHMVFVPAAE